MNLPLFFVLFSIVTSFRAAEGQDQSNGTECVVQGNSSRCKFDTSQLNLDAGSVLQFFDKKGKKIKCNKKALENGWYGDKCDGNARDANFIQRKNHKGVAKVFGSIRVGTDVCRIQPNALGVEEMICTPETEFPPEDEGLETTAGTEADYDAHVRHLQVGFDPTVRIYNNVTTSFRGSKQAQHRQLYDDSGATIDVMVVWTKQAECKNSGLPNGCTLTATTETNMRGLIDLAVAETNTAYSLSGILSSLRLVHAYRDDTYVESTSFDTMLSNLGNTTDGKLDSVHAKRTLYGADMVQMIVSQQAFCGIAFVNSARDKAFSVVATVCATGYYSYAHEIGHNFVMKHDRGAAGQCTNTGFNFGYRSPVGAFRSILAYDCKPGQCDNMNKTGCTRVQRFSNSQYLYNGQPIGNAANNNALQFNNLRALVASHFPAMNCQSNNQCNDNNANTVDTCNVAKAVCVFTPIPTSAPTKAPTKVPTKAPTKAPTSTPTKSPTPPTKMPTKSPTNAPTKEPTKTPTSTPTKSPTAPTKVPTKSPTNVPTKEPTKAPTSLPTKNPTIPTKSPTKAPTKAPTKLPTKAPTMAPVQSTPSFFMESKLLTGVSSAGWTVVSLSRTFISPIPVCSVQYDTGTTLLPAVVRMQNVGTTSFEIRLQNPSNQVVDPRPVHCVIVEEGKYSMPDGRKMEAKKYSSTVTDHDKSWVGQPQTFANIYTNPIVLGQVMTYAVDSRWSVFYSRASTNPSTPPSKSAGLRTGKHVGEDTPVTRPAEIVGYIVMERGHSTSGGIEIESGRTGNVVVGYVGTKVSHTFSTPFAATPVVTVVSQAGMKGREGSWAVLTGANTATTLGVAVDEDQNADTERDHPTEEVDYIVFSSTGAIPLTPIV